MNKFKELYINRISEIDGGFSLKSEYKNGNTKVIMHHTKCDRDFSVYPVDFLRSKKCPVCETYSKRDTDWFKYKCNELYPNIFEVISEYTGTHMPITLKRIACGCLYETTPNRVINKDFKKDKCKFCDTSSEDKFKNILYEENYTLESPYINTKHKVILTHLDCGFSFPVRVNHFLYHHTRCPNCFSQVSKAHRKITRQLQDRAIQFTFEKTFSDLKNISNLRFDFFLDDINTVIEYDGEHHFHPVIYNKETPAIFINKHEKLVYNDKIKNKYCIDRKINLFRIKYSNYTITELEQIITFILKEGSTTSHVLFSIYKENNDVHYKPMIVEMEDIVINNEDIV